MSLDKKLLSAYALGELQGEALERARAIVNRDLEARIFVDQIRAVTRDAAADLAKEPIPQGKGAASIRAEIDRRAKQKTAAAPVRGWWREATALALVLVAVGVVGHKKILRSLKSLGPEQHAEVDYQTESFFGSQGMRVEKRQFKKLVPEKFGEVFQTFALLDSRQATGVDLGQCHFLLPEATDKDVSTEEGTQIFREYLGEGGVLVQVMAAAFPKQNFPVTQGEELSKTEGLTFIKQVTDEGPASYFQVPIGKEDPVCGLKVLLPQMDFALPETSEAKAAANNFAKKLASTIEVR